MPPPVPYMAVHIYTYLMHGPSPSQSASPKHLGLSAINTTVNQPTTRHASDEGSEETQIVEDGVKKQGDTQVADNVPSLAQGRRRRSAALPGSTSWIPPSINSKSDILDISTATTHRSLQLPRAPLPAFPIFLSNSRRHDERAGGMSSST